MSTVIADLDDRDRAARAPLHLQLRERRQQLGWSQAKVGRATGIDAASVRRRERLGVDQSYAATIMQWANALGMRLVLEPVGFPAPPATGALDDLLAAVGSKMTSAAWQSAALLADLVRIRLACRVTQGQLGAKFGTSEQAVSMIETGGSSTYLVVLQRHARGIGQCAWMPDAHLSVYLENDTKVV